MTQRRAILDHEFPGRKMVRHLLLGCTLFAPAFVAVAQSPAGEDLAAKVRQLTDAVSQTQKDIERSQRELEELRSQLAALQQQISGSHPAAGESSSVSQLSAAVDQIREQQAIQETQIATHEQAKVESESKYPIKLSGLVLLTGFVNTAQVDNPVSPSMVIAGSGSSGISLRQTVLGFDARGPRVFNAQSRADLRVDFDGSGLSNSGAANAYTGGLLRLRTAHATLDWKHRQAFFSLDHPIIAPNTPTSLTAVAVPALAWSGNLWTWNPQVGLTHDLSLTELQRFRIQGALIDVESPQQIYPPDATTPGISVASTSESSRWPGAEGRVAFLNGAEDSGLQLGVGGLFVPHRSPGGVRFNSWAGTLDYRIPLPGRASISGSGYAGQALGGLGGGAYKDYVYNSSSVDGYSFQLLHDVGGWVEWKDRASEHLEFNLAFGTDQVPASQLRPYAGAPTAYYLNLARNRTYTGNVIYRPSAYLMFSMEYRHIQSSPVNSYTASGDVIGIATGYRF